MSCLSIIPVMASSVSKKVAVGLSGGVDSSVAALLLKQQGYEVTGVYLQCWETKMDGCASDEDRAYAVQVAAQLGIGFERLDFKEQYKTSVIDYFYSEYQRGRTPNPDVMCNKEIKFGLFYAWAMQQGYDFVATGHYARTKCIDTKTGSFQLLRGKDASKDQSYFLYLLTKEQLPKVLFPIGDMKKTAVRKIAKEANLITYNRPESMGICFIGEVDMREFLTQRISPAKGKVLSPDGTVIGEHDGVWFYTIGQRHGFSVNKYSGVPLYVVGKRVESNELIVGTEREACKKEFVVKELHWFEEPAKSDHIKRTCSVRIRHLGELYKATIEGTRSELTVKLLKPVFGVAPGQSAVFYIKDQVLGGGVIQ